MQSQSNITIIDLHNVNYMSIIIVMACLLRAILNPSTHPFCKDAG